MGGVARGWLGIAITLRKGYGEWTRKRASGGNYRRSLALSMAAAYGESRMPASGACRAAGSDNCLSKPRHYGLYKQGGVRSLMAVTCRSRCCLPFLPFAIVACQAYQLCMGDLARGAHAWTVGSRVGLYQENLCDICDQAGLQKGPADSHTNCRHLRRVKRFRNMENCNRLRDRLRRATTTMYPRRLFIPNFR